MIVTIFKELYKTDVPYKVSIEKIIDRIKTGKSKVLIQKIRSGDKELKKKLPCIIFSGVFSQRNKKSLVEHSGLMVIDYDNVEDVQSFKSELTQNEHVYLCFESPSGNGVKAVVKIPKCDADTHARYFKSYENDFPSKYLDTGGSNVDRVCFESYDPDIYINNDATIYSPTLEDRGHNSTEKPPLLPITEEDRIIEKILSWNWDKSFVEGQRNNYIFDLSGAFCEYGVNRQYAEEFILNHIATDPDFSEREVRTTVQSAYKLRTFGIRYFEDYSKKKAIERDLKYDKSEVKAKHGITDETYEQLSDEVQDSDWWFFDKKGNVKIDPYRYKLFLESHGYRKYYPNDVMKPQLVQVNSNKVKDTSRELIKDFVLNWLLDKGENAVWSRCVNYQNVFADEYLMMLDTIDLMMLKDTKDKCYIAFQNGIVEVSRNSVQLIDYIDVDGYIWDDTIIQREFIKSKSDNDYKKFIENIAGGEPYPIECTIGYLLSGYKNKMNNKAIILNDEVISENPEGGTGKGLFIQGIRQIKKTAILDGKAFDDKKSFPYQTVSQDTSVLVFDDVKKNFDFESKFSLVTEGLTLERKNKDAIKLTVEESPKIVISTNYAIKGEGNSHDRRRHELEFAQHYNGQNTPFDEFGRLVFDDWSKADYQAFDNYMIECLQKYLKDGLVHQNAKNLKLRKFIAETSMEFYEWIEDGANCRRNERVEKKVAFDNFTSEYRDFQKWLSAKRFNIWIQKYCAFKGFGYESGVTVSNRWFIIKDSNYDESYNSPF